MYKVSLGLNVLLVAALGYMIFKSTNPSSGKEMPHCITCDTPFVGIQACDFIKVVARYRDSHWKIINANATNTTLAAVSPENYMGSDYVDSRSVWFSLDRLKAFICNIEKFSDMVPTTRDSLGIRFYFATYPKEERYAERQGQHTLFMVPTTQVEGETTDFEPILSSRSHSIEYFADHLRSAKCTDTLMIFGDLKDLRGGTAADYSTYSFSWNNGKLCPTNCPTQLRNTTVAVDAPR